MNLTKQLYISGKIKELLGQNREIDRKYNKSLEHIQIQKEKNQTVPLHLFIDQDLLESVHLISSLFFEMKAILDNCNGEKKTINVIFRKYWDSHQFKKFTGYPENTREIILEIGLYMSKGDWRKCRFLFNLLGCWDQFYYFKEIKKNIFKKIKEECVRCYLISKSRYFSEILLIRLAEFFKYSLSKIIQLCSCFILNKDFKGSINLIKN